MIITQRILVAYASGAGSTAEVANAIGDVIQAANVKVDILPAREVTDVHEYQAVVLGSSIRLGRWLPDAVQFLERMAEQLSTMPMAYFTTCLAMVDDTAESRRTVLAYMEPIRQLAPEITPVGIGLFAGSFDPTYRQVMPGGEHGPHGDYRNWEAIRAWAAEIQPLLSQGRVPADDTPLDLHEAVLCYTDLSHTDLSRVDLQNADLHEANLTGVNLRQADLRESDLTETDLHDADLEQTQLHWATMPNSQLQNANLRGANLIGVELSHADLTSADCQQAILNGAILKQAILREADLSYTDLNWADLSNADLTATNLTAASLGWANLTGATLTDANLSDVRYNDYTQWPDGFDPDGAGGIRIGHGY